MASDLEQLPYRKRFPITARPSYQLIVPIFYGLVCGLAYSLLFSTLFGTATWNTLHAVLTKVDPSDKEALQYRAMVYLLFWCVVSPWRGLLWGMFLGILAEIGANRTLRRNLEKQAERIIREPSFFRQAFCGWYLWPVVAPRLVWIVVAFLSTWMLGISIIATALGMLAAGILNYPVNARVYTLAKEKYAAAIEEGRLDRGTLRPSRLQEATIAVTFAVFAGFTVFILIGMWKIWPEVYEAREFVIDMTGSLLMPVEAARLEHRLASDPDNWQVHLQLAAYYAQAPARFDPSDEAHFEVREKFYSHALWLIEHYPQAYGPLTWLRPRDGEAYETAKRLWMRNLEAHSDNPNVLGNAADFFEGEDNELAVKLLQKAKALDPDNPEWDRRISEIELKREPQAAREAAQAQEPESKDNN